MNVRIRTLSPAVTCCLVVGSALLSGCKSNADRANEMADAVCACSSVECADEADTKGENEMLRHLPKSISDEDRAKIQAARKRSSDCLDKLIDKKK